MIAGHENQGALLWELNSPFKVDEIDVGDPVADEVQIRVHAAGMCHSDYHLTTGATRIALPALGGKAIADGTSRVHAGSTEVAPMNLLGTFAPYMTVHKDSVVKIDPDIPFESAAIMGCAVPTGFGSATNVAEVQPKR